MLFVVTTSDPYFKWKSDYQSYFQRFPRHRASLQHSLMLDALPVDIAANLYLASFQTTLATFFLKRD